MRRAVVLGHHHHGGGVGYPLLHHSSIRSHEELESEEEEEDDAPMDLSVKRSQTPPLSLIAIRGGPYASSSASPRLHEHQEDLQRDLLRQSILYNELVNPYALLSYQYNLFNQNTNSSNGNSNNHHNNSSSAISNHNNNALSSQNNSPIMAEVYAKLAQRVQFTSSDGGRGEGGGGVERGINNYRHHNQQHSNESGSFKTAQHLHPPPANVHISHGGGGLLLKGRARSPIRSFVLERQAAAALLLRPPLASSPSSGDDNYSDDKPELRYADTTSFGGLQDLVAGERKRISRPLTGRHVRHGTGASPATLVVLRNLLKERQRLRDLGLPLPSAKKGRRAPAKRKC